MSRSRATKVAAVFMEVEGEVQDSTRASIAHDAGDGNILFPSVDAAARRDRRAPKGSTCEPTTFKLQIVPRTTCVSDQQTRSLTTRSKGGVSRCAIQVQVTTMTVSLDIYF